MLILVSLNAVNPAIAPLTKEQIAEFIQIPPRKK